MGHFSGAFCLCVKTSLHIKPINGKCYTCRFIFMQIKLILRWKFCTRTCFETVRHTVKSEIAWNKKNCCCCLYSPKYTEHGLTILYCCFTKDGYKIQNIELLDLFGGDFFIAIADVVCLSFWGWMPLRLI